jgi:pyroglutamyl-peptidase
MSLPVVFSEGAEQAIRFVRSEGADAVICLGQAGGRECITPELVAINLRNADIPDNKGNRPQDEPVIPGGDAAIFSTLPVRRMAEEINGAGIPSRLSYSAGAYVCNDLLYTLLSHYRDTDVRVCFIHIPYCKEQGKEPSMELSDIARALEIAIKSID